MRAFSASVSLSDASLRERVVLSNPYEMIAAVAAATTIERNDPDRAREHMPATLARGIVRTDDQRRRNARHAIGGRILQAGRGL